MVAQLLTGRLRPATIVNLTIHGVGPTDRQLDPGEDRFWLSVGQLEMVLDAVVGRDDVRISFDDGNASDVEYALSRLVERGLTAEFFVPAGLIGKPGRIDRDGLAELRKAGMPIGSHGWAHRDWRCLDESQVKEEIYDARHVLAELTGEPVSRVAIPFGSYDRHVLRRLRQAGVTNAFTSDGGRSRREWWLQPRTSLYNDVDANWVTRVLDGQPSLAVRARRHATRTVKRIRG
jgi:peptidoglycan/xylan/chitin deacetylase (PgdA/CDA1 family)